MALTQKKKRQIEDIAANFHAVGCKDVLCYRDSVSAGLALAFFAASDDALEGGPRDTIITMDRDLQYCVIGTRKKQDGTYLRAGVDKLLSALEAK